MEISSRQKCLKLCSLFGQLANVRIYCKICFFFLIDLIIYVPWVCYLWKTVFFRPVRSFSAVVCNLHKKSRCSSWTQSFLYLVICWLIILVLLELLLVHLFNIFVTDFFPNFNFTILKFFLHLAKSNRKFLKYLCSHSSLKTFLK